MNVRDRLAAIDEQALFMDGFDDAVVGFFQRCGQPMVVAYDYDKCIAALQAQGLTREDAEEYFESNCEGAWVGERTPAILHPLPDEEV